MSSVSSHSIMTGYCFTGLRGCGTLLFLSVLLVAAQSAPLNCTHQHCTEQGLPLNANDAHVSNKIMKLALEELLPKTEAPHQNFLALLTGDECYTNMSEVFAEGICPLLYHYTLHSMASKHLDNNETLTRSALISLLLENVLELSCNYVKTLHPDMSTLNCTVSSVAQFCLSLEPTGQLQTEALTESLITLEDTESWLRKTVPGSQVSPRILQTLSSILRMLLLKCNFPPANATTEQITCIVYSP